MNMFTPNWKRLGLKSKKDGIEYVLSFLKKYEKVIADRGYGQAFIMNGHFSRVLELKGSVIKRKKEVIQL